MDIADIEQELLASGLFTSPLTLVEIDSGAINKSYKLSAHNSFYFVKTFESNNLVPLDRHAQFKVQLGAAELGIAPTPIYLSNHRNFQVDEWVEHTSLANCNISIETKVSSLSKALVDIHSLDINAPLLDLPNAWAHYLKQVTSNQSAAFAHRVDEGLKTWSETKNDCQVLCHNDLAMAHVTSDAKSRVFDWEYAAKGNAFFDLAACAQINRLDLLQQRLLIVTYSDIQRIDANLAFAKFEQQKALVSLTNDLWFLAMGIPQQH